jgi:hypothetical protein
MTGRTTPTRMSPVVIWLPLRPAEPSAATPVAAKPAEAITVVAAPAVAGGSGDQKSVPHQATM